MLGRRGALEVLNTFTEDHVESIKKVDIDIFKSGRTKNMISRYSYTVISKTFMDPAVSIDYANDIAMALRFKIAAKPEENPVVQVLLDDEIEINFSPDNSNSFYYAFATPTETGEHWIHVETLTGKKCDFRFYILQRQLEKGSSMDIPVDSYRDALLNVTKLWLLSNRFDRVRHADWAGFFDDRLRRYQMSDEGKKKVEDDLIAAINNKIKDVIISEATATPLLEERAWDVSVVSTDASTMLSLKSLQNSEDAHIKISEREDIINHEE